MFTIVMVELFGERISMAVEGDMFNKPSSHESAYVEGLYPSRYPVPSCIGAVDFLQNVFGSGEYAIILCSPPDVCGFEGVVKMFFQGKVYKPLVIPLDESLEEVLIGRMQA